MLNNSKDKIINDNMVEKKEEKDFYPLLHVAKCVNEYRTKLEGKEVLSQEALGDVRASFDEMIAANSVTKDKLGSFEEIFEQVDDTANRFKNVKDEILDTVNGAKNKVDGIKESSKAVQTHFLEIQSIFTNF